MEMMHAPLDIAMEREGSGTSWLPDMTPMYAVHRKVGMWNVMLHDNAFLQYIDERGTRGDEQFGSINWFMGMASRDVAGGMFTARAMPSLEPLTVGKCGYPDLLASGELCHGERLHDRQHPHDLFMEVAVRYQHAINGSVAYDIYAAPAGEPALGPTAYPHRISSQPNPFAPISHHWLDATHISFGVATAGVYGRMWKAEASIFNGREPDEDRYGFDLASLDSYSGRLWFLPTPSWALQVSGGRLKEAETEPGSTMRTDVDRVTASATYHRMLASAGVWATTVGWGRNKPQSEDPTQALLIETNLTTMERHIVFGRIEVNQKTGHDLALPPALAETRSTLTKLQGGYTYELPHVGALVVGVGGSVSLSIVPDELRPFYTSVQSPTVAQRGRIAGFAVFLNVHPVGMPPMIMEHH
jgi:hypothetical protein